MGIPPDVVPEGTSHLKRSPELLVNNEDSPVAAGRAGCDARCTATQIKVFNPYNALGLYPLDDYKYEPIIASFDAGANPEALCGYLQTL
jgi:hypothetical protein